MKPLLHLAKKCAGLLTAFLLIASFNASAQKKSVYDVIPGSGPKKQPSKKGVIFEGSKEHSRQDTYPVHTRKRKNLPPGQAKKIYGGSAKDYAPGQVKKRHHHYKDRDKEHGKHGENDQGENEQGERHGKGHGNGHGKDH